MDNKLIQMVVVVTVGIIFLGSLLAPVISDASTTEKTFTNEGYYYMQKISAEDATEHVLTYDYNDGDFIFTLDGVDISDKIQSDLSTTVATDGESWILRASKNEYVGLQGSGSTIGFGGHNSVTANVTFNAGTVTITRTVVTDGGVVPGSTLTGSYEELWIISNDPTDYVMKKADTSAYILKDTEYLAVGITGMTAWNTVIVLSGDSTDFDATIVYPPNLTTTVTNKAIDETEVDGYVDLYSLTKLTFTINDGTTTKDAIYSYFIVPSKVTAELEQHLDTSEIALLAVIPIMVIAALLMFAVRTFTGRD